MNHTDENILELYVLGAPEVQDRTGEIAAHLKICAGCRQLCGEIEAFYREVEKVAEEQERKASEAIVVRAVGVETPERGFAAGSPHRLPVRARIVLFVVRHPVVAGGSLLGAIILLALGLSLLRLPSDARPAHLRAANGALIVMNAEGRELWRKYVGNDFTEEILRNQARVEAQIADVDGDDMPEVLLALGQHVEWGRRNAVVCLASDGTEKWSYEIHRNMVFGSEEFADTYWVKAVLAGDFGGNGTTQVVVIAQTMMYYPCMILCLDGRTGKPVSEYWHAGLLGFMLPLQREGGRRDVVVLGENNGYNRAVLVALDPLHMSGHGPAPPEYTPRGIPRASERAYILLPPTDLNTLGRHRPSAGSLIPETSRSILAATIELSTDRNYALLFHFDSTLHCTKVVGSDEYMRYHGEKVASGDLARPADASYFEDLRREVRYWNGAEFVLQGSAAPPVSRP